VSSWESKAKGQTNCNPKIVLMVFYTEQRLESAGVLVLSTRQDGARSCCGYSAPCRAGFGGV